jgi:tetratricopeptide (TPR) repeat protein
MEALTVALARDPARSRRRWMIGVAAGLAVVGAAVGAARTQQSVGALCRAGPARLADSWTGEPVSGSPRRRALQTAFLATGLPAATEAWERVGSLLDRYAADWLKMYRESCEATHVRGEQSAEVLDLRMACLDERRAALKALTDVFASADQQSVGKGVDAVHALPALDRCADVRLLRAAVAPPRDPGTRARVDDLQRRAAVAKALYDTGRNQQALQQALDLVAEARGVGYAPQLAELLEMVGAFQQGPLFRADSVRALEEAIWTAIRSRRDDIAARAASQLAWMVGDRQRRADDGERWADLADALLDRMGEGNELIRAWVLNSRAGIENLRDPAAGLRFGEQSLALKRKILPPDHPDIAMSLQNIAESHHRLGDDAGALIVVRQAQELYGRAYGPSSAFAAESLSNGGEYLVALGRPAEALPMFRDALARWESELDPHHPLLAYPLTGLGAALLALGRPAEARAPLERALQIREAGELEPEERAETRFTLARALWATGNRARAATLAAEARKDYATASKQKSVAEVDRWLAGPRPPQLASALKDVADERMAGASRTARTAASPTRTRTR